MSTVPMCSMLVLIVAPSVAKDIILLCNLFLQNRAGNGSEQYYAKSTPLSLLLLYQYKNVIELDSYPLH